MFRSPSPLWLLPDLGMDSRSLALQAEHFANFSVPPLAKRKDCESLEDLAAKTVERWIGDEAFDPGSMARCFLGGVGWGGLLALEIARCLSARRFSLAGIVLIASARTYRHIARSYRWKLTMLAELPSWLGTGRSLLGFGSLAASEGLAPAPSRILHEIARDVDWAEVRWQAHAMVKWKRHREDFAKLPIPIHQIHGRGDRFFRVPPVEDATILIRGRHWIQWSLPGEVNRWLESIVRDYDVSQPHRVS